MIPGIELICVGIGKDIKKAELIKIAGDENRVYTAADFNILVSPAFTDNIKARACPGNQGKELSLVDYNLNLLQLHSGLII